MEAIIIIIITIIIAYTPMKVQQNHRIVNTLGIVIGGQKWW